jgi:subtilase family serine protease
MASPAPLADLTIDSATYTEPNVTVRIRNNGDTTAPAFVLAVLLLKKIDPDTGKPEALQFPIPSMAAGALVEKTVLIGNKPFTNNGALAVVLDYKNQVVEKDERNNRQDVTSDLPDLIIQSVEIINNKASVTVLNRCKGYASPAKVDMIVYKGADKKSGWESVVSDSVPALAPNASAKIVIDLNKYSVYTKTLSGRYVRIEVDMTNAIKEAVETNNWWESGVGTFASPASSCNPPQ